MMKKTILLFALLLGTATLQADNGDQAQERINPELEVSENRAVDYSKYRFLHQDKNKISLNGDDWGELAERFAAASAGDTCFSIVYLGDSHIQADFGGSVLRERMAAEAGSAGRGIIIPFKIAGTNQPVDYTITTETSVQTSRLLKQPWVTGMPFTGIGVQPVGNSISLTITVQEPFDRLMINHLGGAPRIVDVRNEGGEVMIFCLGEDGEIFLHEPMMAITLEMAVPEDFVLGGVTLSKADAGVFVHSIGNNGATYGTYNGVDGMAEQVRQLHPDLIIVALGTNEAFGRLDAAEMAVEVQMLTTALRVKNPDAKLLLVTPTECYRKKYRWRGGRRRVTGQTVNHLVKTSRNVVRDFARNHNIALYDTYEIVGGDGAASKMKNTHVLGHDGVHFTSEGYRLQGSLLADALLELLAPAQE